MHNDEQLAALDQDNARFLSALLDVDRAMKAMTVLNAEGSRSRSRHLSLAITALEEAQWRLNRAHSEWWKMHFPVEATPASD